MVRGVVTSQARLSARWTPVLPLLSILALLSGSSRAADIPLIRDPRAYLILGMRSAKIANIMMETGCNVGVNCAPTTSTRGGCGFLHGKRQSLIPSPGQVAANLVCGGGSFFQVFANALCSEPTCAQIVLPGSKPDCTDPFAGPILGDLDGNGIPSCDSNCNVDSGDVAAACGVTLPLPLCDPSTPVTVEPGADCSVGDVMPGNGQCDLAPGTYGAVRVKEGARIFFSPGTNSAA